MDFTRIINENIESLGLAKIKTYFLSKKNGLIKRLKDFGIKTYQIESNIKNVLFTFDVYATKPIEYELLYNDFTNVKISLIEREKLLIKQILNNMGFTHHIGKEIVSKWSNFDFLNIDESHPSISFSDTFFLDDSEDVLSAHATSNDSVMLRSYEKSFCIQRVYRNDKGPRHLKMFNQMDIILKHHEISIYDLLILISRIIKYYLKEQKIRIRKSFFPFTRPSFEFDIFYNESYCEILGCGMMHHKILKKSNIEEKCIAVGMGIERLVMIKYNIKNIKDLYDVN